MTRTWIACGTGAERPRRCRSCSAISRCLQRARPNPRRRDRRGDNGSTDATATIAARAGATVLHEPERGYGAACLRALAYLRRDPPDVVVFMDADRSDDADDLPALLQPLLEAGFDMVVGSRMRGQRERGALLRQARFGNWLATRLIRARFGFRSPPRPFRAVRFRTLEAMRLADRDYGWTIEMQIRALQVGARVTEVPVRYRRRVGRSKISGTVSGSVRAGAKILATFWRLRQPLALVVVLFTAPPLAHAAADGTPASPTTASRATTAPI
jgi:glycosyltransferase involved in cell wall biosynthesis